MWQIVKKVKREKDGKIGELQKEICSQTGTEHYKIVLPECELAVLKFDNDGSVTGSNGDKWTEISC